MSDALQRKLLQCAHNIRTNALHITQLAGKTEALPASSPSFGDDAETRDAWRAAAGAIGDVAISAAYLASAAADLCEQIQSEAAAAWTEQG